MTLLYLVPYTPINFLSKYFLNLDFFVQNFIFLTNFNPFVLNTLGFMWSSLFKFIQAFHFLKLLTLQLILYVYTKLFGNLWQIHQISEFMSEKQVHQIITFKIFLQLFSMKIAFKNFIFSSDLHTGRVSQSEYSIIEYRPQL